MSGKCSILHHNKVPVIYPLAVDLLNDQQWIIETWLLKQHQLNRIKQMQRDMIEDL